MSYETQTLLTLALEDLVIYTPVGVMMYLAVVRVKDALTREA